MTLAMEPKAHELSLALVMARLRALGEAGIAGDLRQLVMPQSSGASAPPQGAKDRAALAK